MDWGIRKKIPIRAVEGVMTRIGIFRKDFRREQVRRARRWKSSSRGSVIVGVRAHSPEVAVTCGNSVCELVVEAR